MELTYYSTTYRENKKETTRNTYPFLPDEGRENELINLYPQMCYQTIEGFGGAITESAGYMYAQMNEAQKKEMLHTYFGAEEMKYNLVRIPIDSCDFSLGHYEADSDEMDVTFQHFSFAQADKYIIPLLNDAEKMYGKRLEIMLSPWSPPAYMKTNGERNHGGKLKPEYRKRWAAYICRYIMEYRKRGYHVTRMTMQNEPKAVQTWDSCIYTAQEQKEFLRDYMWPMLQEKHLEDVEIYLWDHNKERAFEWANIIIDSETTGMIAGIAFHWYSGDHFDALRMIREKFPDKKLLLSEACIEYSKYAADDYLRNAQKYAHDMIGNLNEGMNTFIDWNLILNEEGGPNHVGNYCDAPFLYDTCSKQLNRTNIQGYLWHFTHFIEAGSVRIGTTRYTDQVEITAFKRDNQIVFVLLNQTEEEIPVYLRVEDECVKLDVKPLSISSGVIR